MKKAPKGFDQLHLRECTDFVEGLEDWIQDGSLVRVAGSRDPLAVLIFF